MSVVQESFVYEILVHMGIGKVSRRLGRGLAPKPFQSCTVFFSKRNEHMMLTIYRDT